MNRSAPTAIVRPRRRLSIAWIVPVMAAIFAGWLGWQALAERGTLITIRFADGHGIKPGDQLRYRGIAVGEVRDVRLIESLDEIEVTVSLQDASQHLARRGTQFWIVRPYLGLSSIEGLETIVGPRYIAVNPVSNDAASSAIDQFIGLESPPVVESVSPGDLEVVLQSNARGSLAPGAPVTYREVRIGTVLSVGLASDGGSIESRVHIEQPYVSLIREGTRFWDSGGVRAELGITGASFELESLESVVTGAVALATPDDAGEIVHTGHRFAMDREPPEDWIEWTPMAAIGSELLPPGAPMPRPLRAKLAWTEGRIFTGRESLQGWVLQTDRGLLGPMDLLTEPGDAHEASTVLEIEGERLPLAGEPRSAGTGIGLLEATITNTSWPLDQIASPDGVVDCIAVGDPGRAPIPLAAARLRLSEGGGRWLVDEALPISRAWHGAAVVAREDGRVVGILLVQNDRSIVALTRFEKSDDA